MSQRIGELNHKQKAVLTFVGTLAISKYILTGVNT